MKPATLVAFLVAALAPVVVQADDVADYQRLMQENCPTEITSFCGDVPTGDARLLACLYARQDRLSGPCIGAVMTSADRLRTAVISLSDVQRVCANDVARLCPGVVQEEGHLLRCLDTASRRVSDSCNAAIDGAFLRP